MIVQEHDLQIDSVTHWTDSVSVLQWLHSAEKRQNVFVANSAAEILKPSRIDEWKHVKGELNPLNTCGSTLLTCLTTRAVHIEVVRSLDTDSCLVAIKRSIARRGKPTTIISDNGTNFVGSARELKEYINSWNQDQIT